MKLIREGFTLQSLFFLCEPSSCQAVGLLLIICLQLVLQALVLSASILGPFLVYYEFPFWGQPDFRFLRYIHFRTPHNHKNSLTLFRI